MGSGGGRVERDESGVRRGQELPAVKYERQTTDDNAKTKELNIVWCDVPAVETETSLTVCATALATSEAPEPCAAAVAGPSLEQPVAVDDRPAQAWERQAEVRRAEREVYASSWWRSAPLVAAARSDFVRGGCGRRRLDAVAAPAGGSALEHRAAGAAASPWSAVPVCHTGSPHRYRGLPG